jgi:hypothetical protein
MTGSALPKQMYHDWDVEFIGYADDGPVDCVATVVLDYDGSAYEVLRAYYLTCEQEPVSYRLSKLETEQLFTAAQRQYDLFMEEA